MQFAERLLVVVLEKQPPHEALREVITHTKAAEREGTTVFRQGIKIEVIDTEMTDGRPQC
jgi:hypothetical protein